MQNSLIIFIFIYLLNLSFISPWGYYRWLTIIQRKKNEKACKQSRILKTYPSFSPAKIATIIEIMMLHYAVKGMVILILTPLK